METVYSLVVDKSGSKLTASQPIDSSSEAGPTGTAPSMTLSNSGHLTFRRFTLSRFAQALGDNLGRAVLDNTGIQGAYNIVLDVEPGDMAAPGRPLAAFGPSNQENSAGASFLSAVRGLGLKLETRKSAVEYIVVDHADKLPVEN
jgi:uncharacterized protein (TIGR03435 family)